MIIGIDIGNTTVEIGFIKSEKNITSYKLKTDHDKTPDDWYLDIYNLLNIQKTDNIKDVVVSSVVPTVEKKISQAVKKALGKEPLFLNKDIKIPVKNRYRKPEEVGTDRLVNAFATIKKYGYPSVVVDFGTAITFDVINENGEYEGGAIFPGIEASINALFTKTAKLPVVTLSDVKGIIGKTTVDSIKSGIYYGYVSLVEGMISRINKETGTDHTVVITGGNGEFIHKNIKSIYDRYLSMEGIYMIYKSQVAF